VEGKGDARAAERSEAVKVSTDGVAAADPGGDLAVVSTCGDGDEGSTDGVSSADPGGDSA